MFTYFPLLEMATVSLHHELANGTVGKSQKFSLTGHRMSRNRKQKAFSCQAHQLGEGQTFHNRRRVASGKGCQLTEEFCLLNPGGVQQNILFCNVFSNAHRLAVITFKAASVPQKHTSGPQGSFQAA